MLKKIFFNPDDEGEMIMKKAINEIIDEVNSINDRLNSSVEIINKMHEIDEINKDKI